MTATTLLQASEEELLVLLQENGLPSTEDVLYTLLLLEQLHASEAVREACAQALEGRLSSAQRLQAKETLSIFQSVVEYLPWMGEYTALQRENFQRYQQHKAPYEPLLMQTAFLLERYLDLGRQLYLLFELPQEAKICFEDMLRYHPNHAEALYALGRIVDYWGDTRKAATYYERCLVSDPDHVYALLELSVLYIKNEAYTEAVELLQHVLEVEPFMTEAHVHLATAYRELDDLERARQFIDIALDINPHQEQALYWLGTWQWKDEGDLEAAIVTFEKGVDHPIHGDSSLLLSGLAQLHAKQLNEPAKARTYFEKSLAANPRQPETFKQYIQLLEAHYQDIGDMETQYERYLNIGPREADVYVAYADFLIKYLRDYHRAYEVLQTALENDIESEALHRRHEELLKRPEIEAIAPPKGGTAVGSEDEDDTEVTLDDLEYILELDDLIDDSDELGGSPDAPSGNDNDSEDDDDDFSGGGAAGDN